MRRTRVSSCPEQKELENLEHLLYYCDRLGGLWHKIQGFINKLFEKVFNLTVKSVIVGNLENGDDCMVFNMILSITRFTIWKRRLLLF